jgi:catechol 2,3-dioxygenase
MTIDSYGPLPNQYGHAGKTRNRPVVSAIGHVAFGTPDLEAAIWTCTHVMGMRVSDQTPDAVCLTHGAQHHSLQYRRAERELLDHVGLEAADPEAVAEIRSRVTAAGFAVLAEKPWDPGIEEGFVFQGPEGFVFEVYWGMPKREPDYEPLGVRPNRLGHVNIKVRDPVAMTKFFVEIFDFRVSDGFEPPTRYFLRCNADHHGIAIVPGEGVLHHYAWEVQSIADLGRLGDCLDTHGKRLAWGPVRHGVGRNIAAYFVDSIGTVVEFYSDMTQIFDEAGHVPGVWSPDDTRYYSLWAPMRPEGFSQLGVPTAGQPRHAHEEDRNYARP